MPLQVWRSEFFTGNEDDVAGIARVTRSLPGKPDVRVVARAGHWAFLPPCAASQAASSLRLCTDAAGIDRAIFHNELNASIVSFSASISLTIVRLAEQKGDCHPSGAADFWIR